VLALGVWALRDRFGGSWTRGLCGNELLSRLPSPDGAQDAVIYERDCGATTDFSTQVTLLTSGAPLPETPSPIVVIDSDHGRAPRGPGGGPVIEAIWIAPDSLVLRFDARARVFVQQTMAGRVVIRYDSIVSGGA
jgi:hypothetical protein